MKVLFLKDVPGTGRKNDVKDVNDGFARNFLFAKKLAIPATHTTVRTVEQEKTAKEQKQLTDRKKYQDIADKLASVEVTVITKVGEKGKAFGSVNAGQIKKALEKQGIMVEQDWIVLDEPLKTTGTSSVKLKFPQGVSGSAKVTIKSE